MSDYSERHIARPGLGDKMFETSHGAPLSAISASPESTYSDPEVNRTSWDSIMDNYRYTSVVDDSLFDKTRNRNSVSSESVFGFDPYAQYTRPPPSHQFRPLSIMSEMSVHSSPKEDDTMITVCPIFLNDWTVPTFAPDARRWTRPPTLRELPCGSGEHHPPSGCVGHRDQHDLQAGRVWAGWLTTSYKSVVYSWLERRRGTTRPRLSSNTTGEPVMYHA